MEDYHSNGSSDDECYDRVYDDYDDDDTLEEPEVQTDSPFPRREGPSAKIIRKESLLAAQVRPYLCSPRRDYLFRVSS